MSLMGPVLVQTKSSASMYGLFHTSRPPIMFGPWTYFSKSLSTHCTQSNDRRTVTVKVQVAMSPQASLAVANTRLVVLTGNTVPDGGEEVMVTLLQASVAVIDHVTTAFVPQVYATILLGQVIVGKVPMANTVTTSVQVAKAPLHALVAAQVSV